MFPVSTSSSSSSLSRAVQQNYKQRTIKRNDQSSVVRRTFINHRTKRDQSRQRVVEQKAAFKYPDLDTFLILSLFLTRASETDEHKTSLLASMVVMPGICVRWCLSHRAHVIFAILIFCEMFLKVSIEPLGNFQSIMRTVREYLYVAMIYAFVPMRSKLMVATRGKFSVMVVCALVFFVFVLEIRKLVRNSNSNSWWSYVRLAPLCVSSFLLCRKVVVL